MNESKLFYDKDTAPLKWFKFLRICFIVTTVVSFASGVFAGSTPGGSSIKLINDVQAVIDLFICIGLFSYRMFGVVLMFLLWIGQTGLYVWDIVSYGDVFGNDTSCSTSYTSDAAAPCSNPIRASSRKEPSDRSMIPGQPECPR